MISADFGTLVASARCLACYSFDLAISRDSRAPGAMRRIILYRLVCVRGLWLAQSSS